MAIYSTPLGAGTGVISRVVCFTRTHAWAAVGSWGIGLALFGVLFGMLVAGVISLITGPEVLTKIAAVFLGGSVGGLLGITYLTWLVRTGTCTCPAGTFGFCITVWAFRPFAGAPAVPIAPFATPAPASCTVLIPAGCP